MENLTDKVKTVPAGCRRVFKTGESLSFSFQRERREDFKVNLMLAGYPAFWNHDYYDWNIKSNSNYALYITEVSRVSDEIYKVEMINTETRECNSSFHLGGRFKFFLKKGDTFDFQYYYNTQYDYSVRATVENLAYNTLELSFDKAICLPPDFDK